MIRNYLKIARRNLAKNRIYSFINIGGLAVGISVSILIGLWIYDELSFDKSFDNHDRVARVIMHQTDNGVINASQWTPRPLAVALRNEYDGDFSHVVIAHQTGEQILASGTNQFLRRGNYVEPEFLEMLPVKLIEGNNTGLKDPNSIVLSSSLAQALFGQNDPLNQIVKIDNRWNLKVTGIYEDFPANSSFHEYAYLLPWQQFVSDQDWVQRAENNWTLNAFEVLVKLAPNTNFELVSAKIALIKAKHAPEEAKFRPNVFLHPMDNWHLHSDWENGVPVRGKIQFVWLFGCIGIFVLLLACINFMNLSTARSQKRAKEVGIRKAVGSLRNQLITQFFIESFLVVALALVLSVGIVALALPLFNTIADKQMTIPWSNTWFWWLIIGFSLFTGFIAGSYPAFYLSSFKPIKVLKGSLNIGVGLGKLASMSRKVLVVFQFTVSITLIIGTLLVYQQIQYVQNRSIGYDRTGLLTVRTNTTDLIEHYDVIREELLKTGMVTDMAESSMTVSGVYSSDYGLDWVGRDSNRQVDFDVVACTHDFGKTIGWKIKEGRDFSRDFPSDSTGLIMNESAIKYMGLQNPIGQRIKWHDVNYTIIGVVKDLVTNSPFERVKQTVFKLTYGWVNFYTIRLNPAVNPHVAIERITPVFKKYNPNAPFNYRFVNDEYVQKFGDEEKIGKIASIFAGLAIFISCLGLFGLASFMAEQRAKEIGVRKVLGATVANLWVMLSKDFVVLVIVALLIATPITYYLMNNWLHNYEYHTNISRWVFVGAGLGALMVTLLTVSYQSIKAALINPVRSLRSE